MNNVVPFSNQGARRPVADGTQPPHDGSMEARVAKLEVAVDYIQRDVAEIKADLKVTNEAIRKFGGDVNAEFKAVRGEMTTELKAVRSEMRSDTWKMLGVFGTGFALLLAAMAKGFGWF